MFKITVIYFLLVSNLFSDYIRNDKDEIVFDTSTALMWSDLNSNSSSVLWKDAKKNCEDLELSIYKNWRLPNINELYSIVDITKLNPTLSGEFKSKTNSVMWTSTLSVEFSSQVWTVNFLTGISSSGGYSLANDRLLSYRCVRNIYSY